MKECMLCEAIERIQRMEQCFDLLLNAAAVDVESIYRDSWLKSELYNLISYYESDEWLHDYELDENGLLPVGLKRGVLSQDAVYDFLEQMKIPNDENAVELKKDLQQDKERKMRIEADFISSYITSDRRERFAYELQGKKRSNGIRRFCHNADEILIKSKIRSCGKHINDELQSQINASGESRCYVISSDEGIDGREFDKNEILDLIIGKGMPSIAVFFGFAIIETEQEQGPAMKYLLVK